MDAEAGAAGIDGVAGRAAAFADGSADASATGGGALRSGAVTTPAAASSLPATADATGVASCAARRRTWPTRIRLMFSMLFHAASSR